MSLHYNVDEMLKKLNPGLYQLAYSKIVSLKVAEPIDNVKDLL